MIKKSGKIEFGTLIMADENVNIEKFFKDLPSLVSHARRHLFATNVNVCEYWCRRLEDFLNFLIVFCRRVVDVETPNSVGIVSPINIIIQEIVRLKQEFDRILEENSTEFAPVSSWRVVGDDQG